MLIWDYIEGLSYSGDCYTRIAFPNQSSQVSQEEFVDNELTITYYDANRINSYTTNILTNKKKNNLFLHNGCWDYNFNLSSVKATGDYQISWNCIDKGEKSSLWEAIIKEGVAQLNLYLLHTENPWIITHTGISKSNIKLDFAGNSSIEIGDKNNIWDSSGQFKTSGSITTLDLCQALSFNATSDERAKENFTYVPRAHALEWINNLNIYTFNYRDNGRSSIGITTQQVQDKPINNFNFVDNLEATGENGDYMTIKESKLVYMCMSAIQELSQQNQILQNQIYILQSQIDSLTYKS